MQLKLNISNEQEWKQWLPQLHIPNVAPTKGFVLQWKMVHISPAWMAVQDVADSPLAAFCPWLAMPACVVGNCGSATPGGPHAITFYCIALVFPLQNVLPLFKKAPSIYF